jgi:hypothetical protein
MKSQFKIIEIKPRIFLFEFKDYYNLAMHFLRYQEFYESPSAKFRGKAFSIFEYMNWYQKKYGKGIFSYPKDWIGYNMPESIIRQVKEIGIIDKNYYDNAILNAYNKCLKKYSTFYPLAQENPNLKVGDELRIIIFFFLTSIIF